MAREPETRSGLPPHGPGQDTLQCLVSVSIRHGNASLPCAALPVTDSSSPSPSGDRSGLESHPARGPPVHSAPNESASPLSTIPQGKTAGNVETRPALRGCSGTALSQVPGLCEAAAAGKLPGCTSREFRCVQTPHRCPTLCCFPTPRTRWFAQEKPQRCRSPSPPASSPGQPGASRRQLPRCPCTASEDAFCLPQAGLSGQLNTSPSANKGHYHTRGLNIPGLLCPFRDNVKPPPRRELCCSCGVSVSGPIPTCLLCQCFPEEQTRPAAAR